MRPQKLKGTKIMLARLRCIVSPGQFSSEYAVVVQSFNGRSFSLFASRSDVECEQPPTEDQSVDGWLLVEIIGRSANHYLVRLPQSTLENGQHISVSLSQLKDIIDKKQLV